MCCYLTSEILAISDGGWWARFSRSPYFQLCEIPNRLKLNMKPYTISMQLYSRQENNGIQCVGLGGHLLMVAMVSSCKIMVMVGTS